MIPTVISNDEKNVDAFLIVCYYHKTFKLKYTSMHAMESLLQQ